MPTPSLLALASGIFTPLATLIDKMHTSADERAAAQAEILRLHNEALKLAIDAEQHQLATHCRRSRWPVVVATQLAANHHAQLFRSGDC